MVLYYLVKREKSDFEFQHTKLSNQTQQFFFESHEKTFIPNMITLSLNPTNFYVVALNMNKVSFNPIYLYCRTIHDYCVFEFYDTMLSHQA